MASDPLVVLQGRVVGSRSIDADADNRYLLHSSIGQERQERQERPRNRYELPVTAQLERATEQARERYKEAKSRVRWWCPSCSFGCCIPSDETVHGYWNFARAGGFCLCGSCAFMTGAFVCIVGTFAILQLLLRIAK